MDKPGPNDNSLYVLWAGDLRLLHSVKAKLFGDGTNLSPKERHDLAETMRLVLERASPM